MTNEKNLFPISRGKPFCWNRHHCSRSTLRFPKVGDKKGACLREMPQESFEIFDFRLGILASEDWGTHHQLHCTRPTLRTTSRKASEGLLPPKGCVPPWNATRKLWDLHLTTRTGWRTIQMDSTISGSSHRRLDFRAGGKCFHGNTELHQSETSCYTLGLWHRE